MAQAFGEPSPVPALAEIEILKSILNLLADGVLVANQDGRFMFINRAAHSILGIASQGLSMSEWSETYECYPPGGVTRIPPHDLPLARALSGESVEEMELLIRSPAQPDGVWIIAKASPLRNEAGALRGAVMVFRDVSTKREDEERIRTFANAVEQTADSIVITDRNGLIHYVNPAFEQTTGYSREESIGRTPAILKSGVHDAAFYRDMWATIVSGKAFRGTIANKKKNGEIYFAEQTITPIRDAAGKITQFVAVTKDVTEQRKLQEREYQMKLARAIQQQFYRISAPPVEGFDIAGRTFPADETGGDYFDFMPLPDGCIGIFIGDVSGHGISSALLMVELRSYLRAFSTESLDISKILRLVNSALVRDLEHASFATLFLCRLHPPSRSMMYASAGHVPGYILGADGAVKQVLQSIDIPLGVIPEQTFGCSAEIRLEPGEILVLLTDGITDTERPDETQFGAGRALEFIREHRQDSAQHIMRGLFEAVRDFADGLPQRDDITAVICKINR
ncbi:MAG: SpoIIE family protein phosphatase [Acidobacteriota bacterium]|jgi:sigma-B regulation protein RsbU (phosphoserine phosphatase)